LKVGLVMQRQSQETNECYFSRQARVEHSQHIHEDRHFEAGAEVVHSHKRCQNTDYNAQD
jgi:hypothetical protein